MTAATHPECPQCARTAALLAEVTARVDAIAPVIVAAFEAEGRPWDIPAALRPPGIPAPRPSLICLPGGAA